MDASGGDSVKASDISAEKTLLVRSTASCSRFAAEISFVQEMDKIKSRLSQVESEKIDIERRFAGLMQEVSFQL